MMNPIPGQPNFIDNPFIRKRDMERLDEVAKKVESLYIDGPLETTQGSGIHIALPQETGFWTVITAQNPDDTDPDPPQYFYSHTEQEPYYNEEVDGTLQWRDKLGGISGVYNGVLPAREVNGRTDVPVDTIVRVWLSETGDHYEFEYTLPGGGGTPSPEGTIYMPGDDVVNDLGAGEHAICVDISYADLNAVGGVLGFLRLFRVPSGFMATVKITPIPTVYLIRDFMGPGANHSGSWVEPGAGFSEIHCPENTPDATETYILSGELPVGAIIGYAQPGEYISLHVAALGFDIDGNQAAHPFTLSDLTCGYARVCLTIEISELPGGPDDPGGEADCDEFSVCQVSSTATTTAAGVTGYTSNLVDFDTSWTSNGADYATYLVTLSTTTESQTDAYGSWFSMEIDGDTVLECVPFCAKITAMTLKGDLAITETGDVHDSVAGVSAGTSASGLLSTFPDYELNGSMMGINAGDMEADYAPTDADPPASPPPNGAGAIDYGFFPVSAGWISAQSLKGKTLKLWFLLAWNASVGTGGPSSFSGTLEIALTNLAIEFEYCADVYPIE